jgi:SAM-dependent methyltransferase
MPEIVAATLRKGLPLRDAQFDALYPSWARRPGRIHWTPIEVAQRAAQLLVTHSGTRVLDVGAGVGKFCMVGALMTSGVFYGIEQRRHLVTLAKETAAKLGILNTRFLYGNMTKLDWRVFDGFYLYNPFSEHLPGLIDPIDDTVELDKTLYRRYIEFVCEQLDKTKVGTRVVTFHGFGGQRPPAYEQVLDERCGNGHLELWVKTE